MLITLWSNELFWEMIRDAFYIDLFYELFELLGNQFIRENVVKLLLFAFTTTKNSVFDHDLFYKGPHHSWMTLFIKR